MIRYALACAAGHAFDGWFRDSVDFDRQSDRKLVTCPACGSDRVDKALMAPRLARSERVADTTANAAASPVASADDKAPVAILSETEADLRRKLAELRRRLVANSEHVGERFPEEARRIHYGETPRRSIHGEASADEAKALLDEGIAFHPLPVLPHDRN